MAARLFQECDYADLPASVMNFLCFVFAAMPLKEAGGPESAASGTPADAREATWLISPGPRRTIGPPECLDRIAPGERDGDLILAAQKHLAQQFGGIEGEGRATG